MSHLRAPCDRAEILPEVSRDLWEGELMRKWLRGLWLRVRYPRNDVRRYGAVGDGKTDDSAAFQAAIDATGSFSAPGGPYLLGRTIQLL